MPAAAKLLCMPIVVNVNSHQSPDTHASVISVYPAILQVLHVVLPQASDEGRC